MKYQVDITTGIVTITPLTADEQAQRTADHAKWLDRLSAKAVIERRMQQRQAAVEATLSDLAKRVDAPQEVKDYVEDKA